MTRAARVGTVPPSRGTARTSAGTAGPATPKWPRATATGGGVACCTNAGAPAAAIPRESIACFETFPPSPNAVDRTVVQPRPGVPPLGSFREAHVPTGLLFTPSGDQLT